MTLIEAMAFGKPLVASNIKGNRECVRHGYNGFLCTPRRPQEFVAAIGTLRREKDLYHQMEHNCLAMSKEFFDIEVNVASVIRLYEEAWLRLCASGSAEPGPLS